MTSTPDVVVGVDDSPPSLEALRVAAQEAARRRTGLRAVHVWHYPSSWGVPLAWPAGANPGEYVRQRLIDEVDQLQAAREKAAAPPVPVSIEVIEGETERELRAAAKDAPVLVIGERLHHGPSAILGSIGGALAAHPPCPLLIVPLGEQG